MKIGKKSINPRGRCLGFTYIGLMIMIAISGIALAGVGIVWHQDVQREREKELLFIGNEFRKAIGSYYENPPSGGVKQYPNKLEDLLIDSRFPSIKRHLRKIYFDPISNSQTWGLEVQQGQISGVYSISKQAPIKRKGFPPQYKTFSDATGYDEWKFNYTPGSSP